MPGLLSFQSLQVVVFLLLAILSNTSYGDYPVPPMTREKIPNVFASSGFIIGDDYYTYGGQPRDNNNFNHFTKLSFDNDGAVVYTKLNENGPPTLFGQAVVLPGNNTVAVIGGSTGASTYNATSDTPIRGQVYSFIDKTWTTLPGLDGADPSTVPMQRQEHTAVMVNGLIYITGGVTSTNNKTIIRDSWSYNPESGVFTALNPPIRGLFGSTATALPDGRIVFIGGWYSDDSLQEGHLGYYLKYYRLVIHNTVDDTWSTQDAINKTGIPYDMSFVHSSAVLGPEGRYIYFFGGDDYNSIEKQKYNNGLWVLDTQTWEWHVPVIPGTGPIARTGTSAGLLSQKYIVFGYGGARTIFYSSLDILLAAPETNQADGEVDLTALKWVDNIITGDIANQPQWGPSGLSGGVIAAVVIVCVVVVLMLLYLLFRFRYRVRRAIMRIHYGIWNPRTGEPLWAETARLVSKVVLLFLFIAFFVFVLIQVLRSPKATYILTERADGGLITLPDARICFEGFSTIQNTEFSFNYPRVGCVTDAGEACDDHLVPLNLDLYNPRFMGNLGSNVCYLFTGTKDLATHPYETLHLSDQAIPEKNNGTNIQLTFYVGNKAEAGRIHVSFYHEERNPNRVIFLEQNLPKISEQDIADFLEADNDDFSAVNTVDLLPLDDGYVQYQLETIEYLKNIGWNYVGFSPALNSTPEVTTVQRVQTAPGLDGGLDGGTNMIARLTVAPASIDTVIHREQKIYSLVNAIGFIGGLFGLFVAFQTIMFGFRPRSPFGIVHRWSIGDMRRSISSGLKDRFDLNQTPVPLVNPVHDRYSLNLRNYGPNYLDDEEETFIDDAGSLSSEQRMATAAGALSPHTQNGTTNTSQVFNTDESRRLSSVEDRMQLLELVFKSYYVDDEVFRRLDIALKRTDDQGNRTSRRSVGDFIRGSRPGQGYRTTIDSSAVGNDHNQIQVPMREQEQAAHPATVPVTQQGRRSTSSDSS